MFLKGAKWFQFIHDNRYRVRMKKNIIFIGASTGIGLETIKLVQHDYNVYVASRNKEILSIFSPLCKTRIKFCISEIEIIQPILCTTRYLYNTYFHYSIQGHVTMLR